MYVRSHTHTYTFQDITFEPKWLIIASMCVCVCILVYMYVCVCACMYGWKSETYCKDIACEPTLLVNASIYVCAYTCVHVCMRHILQRHGL